MKRLGELTDICAVYPNALMQMYDGTVSVHIGEGPYRKSITANINNEMEINKLIYELKYGKYAVSRKEKNIA